MKKIFKIGVCIGIVFVSTFFVYFGVELYQQIQKEQNNTFQDLVISSDLQTLKDILPVQPTFSGDIPIFVGLLREAKETKDITICESLPEPYVQKFDFDDYTILSPNQISWKNYCQALVYENPLMCPTITATHPNLSQECHHILENTITDETK